MATAGFDKLAPGFDFLQSLAQNAGAAMPHIGQWVAPTLDPAEIDKRIQELRTVQFWLEQNSRMITTTIQALEVQRMTLSTLKTMNVQMSELRDSLKVTPAPAPSAEKKPAAAAPASPVDPMQWWSALTQQFAKLAAGAAKPPAPPVAKATPRKSAPRKRSAKPAK